MNKLLTLAFFLFLSCVGALAQFQPRSVGVVNGQKIRDNDGSVFLDAGGHAITSPDWSVNTNGLANFNNGDFKVGFFGFSPTPIGPVYGIEIHGSSYFGDTVLFDDDVYVNGNIFAVNLSGDGSNLTGISFSQVGNLPNTLSGYGITDAQPGATTAQLLAQTAAVSSVVTVTAPNDAANHLYTCGGTITVTAISANTITLQVTYTDETSASRTQSFFGEGLTVAAVSTTGGFTFPPLTIWAKPNTAITIKTTVTGVGSETYDVAGWIQKLD